MKIEPMHIISLGAGVQSSTMALMAAAGEITPMPSAAIFADTQDEPANVYRWLDWLEPRLPFPVHRVTAGKLSEEALRMRRTKNGRRYTRTTIPVFTLDKNGAQGKIMGRTCTADFKLKPLMAAARKLAGVKRGEKTVKVVQWIGISLDEVQRMRSPHKPWAANRYPLIDAEMTRHDCLRWMNIRGFPRPPRSACVYCPFHSNSEWRRLKMEEPDEFQRAVDFEWRLQNAKRLTENFQSVPYLHRSCTKLNWVDFSTDNERGQSLLAGFNNECEGMCGV